MRRPISTPSGIDVWTPNIRRIQSGGRLAVGMVLTVRVYSEAEETQQTDLLDI